MSALNFWDRLRHALGYYPSTARDWAVRVQSEDVTRQELLALDEWLKADPRNAEAYARVNKIAHLGLMLRDYPQERSRLNMYASPSPSRMSEGGAGDIRRPLFTFRGNLWGGRLAATAASVAILLGVALLLVPDLSPWSNRYVAGKGEQRQVALADGSRMLVNTDSEVKVRYGDAERAIELVRGEAYFEVAKDSTRPFVVRTDGALVRAIGTKFTVRHVGSETEVVVTEGRVEVLRDSPTSPPSASSAISLQPGNRVLVSSSQPAAQVALVDTVRATAWTNGRVEFEEATLADVIRDVNRYTAREFVIADPALAEIRLTGRFRVGDVESVKFALRDRFGIVAVEEKDQIRLGKR